MTGKSIAQISPGMMVPAYFYPGPLWDQAVSGSPLVRLMVMNPNNGPGSTSNPDYVAAVGQAQEAGIEVIGYVQTGYGARELQTVLDEIASYREWYGVDGIFLDEASTVPSQINYYQFLASHIRGFPQNNRLILNPGTFPDEAYLSVADVLVVFEGTYRTYKQLVAPPWSWLHSPDRFAHIVYKASRKGKMKTTIQWSRERNAGLIWVTNDDLPNPFDTLPSYWFAELEQISNVRH